MAIYGNLKTMSLCDLLQWAAENKKTGVLELERNKVSRRIEFRNGWIGACSSDDPPSRLGQFLLARGKITEELLRDALAEQERTHENLGVILTRMGVLTQAELTRQITAKAEETIRGLFDWEDAVFRFHDGSTLDPNQIEISLSVREVLMRGIQHHDELGKIRAVFKSSGVVLAHTDRQPPENLLTRAMSARIFNSVDGERTLAEVLLHAHASEFLVLKLLFRLFELRLVEIKEEKAPVPGANTLLDVDPSSNEDSRVEMDLNLGETLERDIHAAGLQPGSADSTEVAGQQAVDPGDPHSSLDIEVLVATGLMGRGEYAAALELLNASYRAHPDENYLRRLIAKAENGYMESACDKGLEPTRIPVLCEHANQVSRDEIGADVAFLRTLIDGKADIKSIIWLAPLREVETLRALGQMLDRGLIEIRDPQSAEVARSVDADRV